jgi:hypothetical protein
MRVSRPSRLTVITRLRSPRSPTARARPSPPFYTRSPAASDCTMSEMVPSTASGDGVQDTHTPSDWRQLEFPSPNGGNGGCLATPNGGCPATHARTHRSTRSGPAQFAMRLEAEDPHTSVTFVCLAATGARTDDLFRPDRSDQKGEKTRIATPAVSRWPDRACIRKLSAAKWF